jgi:hypothetical protein
MLLVRRVSVNVIKRKVVVGCLNCDSSSLRKRMYYVIVNSFSVTHFHEVK